MRAGSFRTRTSRITLDTFHDKRNGLLFMSSSLGGLRDAAVTDETSNNIDWNTVWDVENGDGSKAGGPLSS